MTINCLLRFPLTIFSIFFDQLALILEFWFPRPFKGFCSSSKPNFWFFLSTKMNVLKNPVNCCKIYNVTQKIFFSSRYEIFSCDSNLCIWGKSSSLALFSSFLMLCNCGSGWAKIFCVIKISSKIWFSSAVTILCFMQVKSRQKF